MPETETESREARAAALWVAREYGLDVDKISGVTFAVYRGGHCETCAYDEPGIEFKYGSKTERRELPDGFKAGDFIAACVALLA